MSLSYGQTSRPELSIIIANWNGADLLESCLEAIERSRGATRIEVIVFDNASSDRSDRVANDWTKRLPVKLLRSSTNLGYAQANNRAWLASRGEFCMLLNNDAIIDGSLQEAVEYMRSHPKVGICQGLVLSADGCVIDSAGSLLTRSGFLTHLWVNERVPQRLVSRPVFSVKGAAMYVRSAMVRRIGLFDEMAFAYFEESDLCWRAQVAGWDVTFATTLPTVLHLGGATSRRLPTSVSEYHSFKNRVRAILKNASLRTLATMLPLHLAFCLGSAAWALAGGRPEGAVNIGRALFWNLRVMRDTVRKRRAVQRLRTRRDSEIFAVGLAGLGPITMFRFALGYEQEQRRHRKIGTAG